MAVMRRKHKIPFSRISQGIRGIGINRVVDANLAKKPKIPACNGVSGEQHTRSNFPRFSHLSINLMSQHPSLKLSGATSTKRSVMKRFERVKLMKKRGTWKEGQSPIGLPKTLPEL